MFVILDSNVVIGARRIDSIPLAALRAVAQERRFQIVLPGLVLEEVRAHRLQELQGFLTRFEQALEDIRRFAPVTTPSLPNPTTEADRWQRQLREQFEIWPFDAKHAFEALLREVNRVAPTREGEGARDAAIWLSIIDALKDKGGVGYFVSNNPKDFADPTDETRLHSFLVADAASAGVDLRYFRSIDRLLETLSLPDASDWLTLEWLARAETLKQMVKDAIERAYSFGGRFHFTAVVDGLNPTQVSKKGFHIGAQSVVVADTRWRLRWELLPPKEDIARSGPVESDCFLQLWIRTSANEDPRIEIAGGKVVDSDPSGSLTIHL